MMDTILQDVRYAARQLIKRPGFTAAVVLTLALGIGATTAVYSVVNAVLLEPPPYRDPSALVAVWTQPAGQPDELGPASLPDLDDWQAQNTVFSGVAGVGFERFEINGQEGTDFVRGAQGTGDLFAVLGTPAFLGRALVPADAHQAVVVLSYRLWLRRYGGDRSVIGRVVDLFDDPYTIVGVMPPAFHFPTPDIDLWTSLNPIFAGVPQGAVNPWISDRAQRGYRVVARLNPGVSLATAEVAMTGLEHRLGATYPAADAGTDIRLQSLESFMVGGVQRPLWLLLGAAGFVLLIACTNVAHLLLSRTAARAREIGVRQALGAGRIRIARQLVTESLLLGLLGGGAGVALAAFGTSALVRFIPADLPGRELVGLNPAVLLFAATAALIASLGFGLAPAWQAWRGRFVMPLSGGTRGAGAGAKDAPVRRTLMAAEVATAVVLLIGAGLLLRSLARLAGADPGFTADHLLTFHVTMPHLRELDAAGERRFVGVLLNEVRALPGVQSAGASSSLPPTFYQDAEGFAIVGRPAPIPGHEPIGIYVPSTPSYLRAVGAPLLAGRDFTDADGVNAPLVALVSRALARRYFDGQNAVGQQIAVAGVVRTVVGVTGDVPFHGLGRAADPVIFVPFDQSPFAGVWVALRTAGDPGMLAAPVRQAMERVSKGLHARSLLTMEQVLHDALDRQRFQSTLLGLFAVLALVLAAIGIYGVMAYGVAQRTGEMGIRLALGATPLSVSALVVRQGMVPVVIGLAGGVCAAVFLSSVLQSLLYGIATTDALTFALVTIVLATTALLAAYLPARRAARTDPVVALRSE